MSFKKISSFFLSIVLGIIGICFLSGCAHYKTQPLNQLTTRSSKKNTQSICFANDILTKNDCKKYLDRNVIRKGYQPVQITVTNNTNRCLKLSKANISLPQTPALEIVKKVHTSTVTRATSYGIASLILWPMVIPAIVDGVGSSQANQKLDQDFAKKELADQVISPFNTINGLIFVPVEKFDSKFSITLIDAQTNERFTLTTKKPFANI